MSRLSCEAREVPANDLLAFISRDRNPSSDLIVHLLRLHISLLEKIRQTRDREDTRDGAGEARGKDVSVNEAGSDPCAEAERAGDQIPDGAAQPMAPGPFLQLARAAFALHLGEGRAQCCRHFILGDDAAELLRGEGKEREVLRLDPLGQWFARAFAGEQRDREHPVEDRDQRGVVVGG